MLAALRSRHRLGTGIWPYQVLFGTKVQLIRFLTSLETPRGRCYNMGNWDTPSAIRDPRGNRARDQTL